MSKIYDLAILKMQKELNTFEFAIKERNNRRKKLEERLFQNNKAIEDISTLMKEGQEINPASLQLIRLIDPNEELLIKKSILKLNDEIQELKNRYLQLKNKREKIEEMKILKEKEELKLKNNKEDKARLNDYLAKRFSKE